MLKVYGMVLHILKPKKNIKNIGINAKKGLSFLFYFDIICKGEVSYVKEKEEGKNT